MIKAVLQHPGGSVDLLEGETIIGRGLSCPIRFNDHSVSRKHLRIFIDVHGVTARDLGSRNGTKVNNVPLEGDVPLEDRDVLQIGAVKLRLAIITTRQSFMDEVTTRPDANVPEEVEATRPLLEEGGWGESHGPAQAREVVSDLGDALASAYLETDPIRPAVKPRRRPTPEAIRDDAPTTKQKPVMLVRDSTELPLPEMLARTCPDCRAQVPMAQEQCHKCGYKWQLRGPLSKTQPVIISSLEDLGLDQDLHDRAMERRAADRVDVEVPVIYHSDNLTFDARAENLSRTGMFIASDLLDAVGTSCTLRVLPDGHAAVSIGGLVKHVVTSADASRDQVPGMGIRFQRISRGALDWIWSMLGDPEGG